MGYLFHILNLNVCFGMIDAAFVLVGKIRISEFESDLETFS